MTRYIRATSIDSKTFEASSDEEAIDKFQEMIKYEKDWMAIKDFYLCKIVAVYGRWNEFPKGFTVISKETRTKSTCGEDENDS